MLLGDLEASLGGFGVSWGCLGGSWGGLGVVLGDLGAILGGLGAAFGRSWAVLGGLGALWDDLRALLGALGRLWEVQNRSKIDSKIDPKSSRIRIGQTRSGATPVVVSDVSAPHRNADPITPENYQNRYRYD